MDIFNNLKQNAKNNVRTIVLPEGDDERIIQAAIKLDKKQLAKVIFSLERITKQSDGNIIYRLNKPLANGQSQLKLSSLELIDKLAALVPPPRIHRHRYYGVLAPNSPFRASVTVMAGLSVTHEPIEVQSSDHNKEEEPIEQEQENKSGYDSSITIIKSIIYIDSATFKYCQMLRLIAPY